MLQAEGYGRTDQNGLKYQGGQMDAICWRKTKSKAHQWACEGRKTAGDVACYSLRYRRSQGSYGVSMEKLEWKITLHGQQ